MRAAGFGSFAALGDSFTEGLSDDLGPTGHHLGWADRVAAALALRAGRVQYANLAVRGRLLDEVVDEQLPLALRLAPDLVSFHAGPNDLLRPRPRAGLPALLGRYDAAVARLRSTGPDVLLFTVIERAGGTGRTADRLAERFAGFNAGVRATARRHDALLVDVGAVPVLQDRRLFHEDRLHLNAAGHARVAAAVLERLAELDPGLADAAAAVGPGGAAIGPSGAAPGWWREPLAAADRPRRTAALRADVRWVRRHLLPWAGRRIRGTSSGDAAAAKHVELVEVLAAAPSEGTG